MKDFSACGTRAGRPLESPDTPAGTGSSALGPDSSSTTDPSIGCRRPHARCETVATKPAFRDAFRQRRCLVVVDSFDVGKGRGRERKAIQMKDGKPFGVGAIWDRWQHGDGEAVESCAIITTAANELVSPINDRMPVIIANEGLRPVARSRILRPPRSFSG